MNEEDNLGENDAFQNWVVDRFGLDLFRYMDYAMIAFTAALLLLWGWFMIWGSDILYLALTDRGLM